MARITVIGQGSWGVALARLLANNGHEVTAWEGNEAACARLMETRENAALLPGVKLPAGVHITSEVSEAGADGFVFAVPSHAVRAVSGRFAGLLAGKVVVSAAKGIEDGTFLRMTEIIREAAPGCRAAALTGPSHAEEVARDVPTAVVAAAYDEGTARAVQDWFMSGTFRVYVGPDVKGAELGGALKNVIALAAGVSDGLGFGDNTKAALMTRGLAEITRLGAALGADEGTFAGLTGIGDLIVTCTSMHSRNRRAGILLGQGKTPEETLAEVKMVVEGVTCAKAAKGLAERAGVEMPIVTAANEMLFEGKAPGEAVERLMARDKAIERFGA